MAGELILVVEDNDKSRKLVRDMLTAKGHTVVEACNGEDGVRLAGERLPQRTLMDIRLPGLDGVEACIIMAAGFDGYRSKPLDVKTFLAAVASILAR
jgi:CheY-like chemotaxis protein